MFLVCDVHISRKVVNLFTRHGHKALHVNDILDGSETKDTDICRFADINDGIVVTKDSDFRDSHLVSAAPKKLIKINLGNISNEKLMEILEQNMDMIGKLDKNQAFLLEIDTEDLTVIIAK